MKTEMNFVDDLRDHVAAELTAAGYPLALSDGQTTDKPHDLLMLYWSARARRIAQQPRNVEWSRELRARLTSLPQDIAAGLATVEREFITGADITPRLSRQLKKYFNDALLNDWGIHHIHLGSVVESDGFLKRTGDVLFALVREDAVYFLDVRPHGAWEDEDLVEMIHEQWPATVSQFRMSGLRFETDQISREARRKLRKGGVYTPYQTSDGTAYGLLGGGYATTGDNLRAVVWGDSTIKTVRRIEEAMVARTDEFASLVEEKTGAPPSQLVFRLVPQTDKFEITGYTVHIENTTPSIPIPIVIKPHS